jgi:hypothetical protein
MGKTSIINLEPGGVIDIWICNPDDILSGIGQKAVRHRLRALKSPNTSAVVELDGEGWVKTRDKDLILRNLELLGFIKARMPRPA